MGLVRAMMWKIKNTGLKERKGKKSNDITDHDILARQKEDACNDNII